MFIAVTVDNVLQERRPAAFHIVRKFHHALAQAGPFFRGHVLVAPVIDIGCCMKSRSQFAGHVQHIAEFHPFQVVIGQLNDFPGKIFVILDQCNKSLLDNDGIDPVDITHPFFRFLNFKRPYGRCLHPLPDRGIFTDSEILADLRQKF